MRLPSKKPLLVAFCALFLFTSLLIIARNPAKAAQVNNPVFATIQYVQTAISTALLPIQSAITNLQAQQTNQATQINSIQTQLNSSQNSEGKSLRVYDA